MLRPVLAAAALMSLSGCTVWDGIVGWFAPAEPTAGVDAVDTAARVFDQIFKEGGVAKAGVAVNALLESVDFRRSGCDGKEAGEYPRYVSKRIHDFQDRVRSQDWREEEL